MHTHTHMQSRHFSSVHASDVAEQKDLLLERLADLDTSNKTLRKLLRTQQTQEVRKPISQLYNSVVLIISI